MSSIRPHPTLNSSKTDPKSTKSCQYKICQIGMVPFYDNEQTEQNHWFGIIINSSLVLKIFIFSNLEWELLQNSFLIQDLCMLSKGSILSGLWHDETTKRCRRITEHVITRSLTILNFRDTHIEGGRWYSACTLLMFFIE